MPHVASFPWITEIITAFSNACAMTLGMGLAVVIVIFGCVFVAGIIAIGFTIYQLQFLPATIPSFMLGGISVRYTYDYLQAHTFSIWIIPSEVVAGSLAILPPIVLTCTGIYLLVRYGRLSNTEDVEDNPFFIFLRRDKEYIVNDYVVSCLFWSVLAVTAGEIWICYETYIPGASFVPLALSVIFVWIIVLWGIFDMAKESVTWLKAKLTDT
jgi:hypothetical protein